MESPVSLGKQRGWSRRRTLVVGVLAVATACWLNGATAASSYPNHEIRLIVPYTAGGTSDLIGRIIAKGLTERLKVPVVVINRPGASGTMGMKLVATSAPDGYTIGIAGTTNLAIAPYLMSPPPYDPVRDFTALSMAARAPFILVTAPKSNIRSMKELIAYGKAHPDKLNYGSSGVGSSHHLTTELFMQDTGFTATHIPFKGGAENVTQLLAGTVDFMFESSSSILPQVKAGKVHALAVTGDERLPELPDVPTVEELGIKNFMVESTIGVVAPAKLSADAFNVLSTTLHQMMQDPAIREAIGRTGSGAPPLGKDQFGARLKLDAHRWSRMVKKLGIAGK